MHELTDAQLNQLVAELDLNVPIRAITIEDDTMLIHTPWEAIPIPSPHFRRADTRPRPTVGPAEAAGLDDFTAIDGVGPVTASRLHNAGYYTYDDLRDALDHLTDIEGVNPSTVQRIQAWLDQRLAL